MTTSIHPPYRALVLALGACMAACADEAPAQNAPIDQNPITGNAGTAAPIAGGASGAGGVSAQPPSIGAGTGGTGAAGVAAPTSGTGGGAAGTGSGSAGMGSAGQGGAAAGSGGGGSEPDASVEDAGGDAGGEPDAGEPMPDAAIGNGGTVSETIVVRSGQTFDGRNRRYVANPDTLGDGSQDEGQLPVFELEDGARLINVVLGAPAADGIHTYGDVTLENIVWEDVGEDAMTIKESGTVVLDGGSATAADDKIFQINAASTFRVSNFRASNAGKFIRQNGGTTFRVDVVIDRCDISSMDEAIFRTDSDVSTVRMTNTRYSNIGEELFMGVNPANITQMNNTPY